MCILFGGETKHIFLEKKENIERHRSNLGFRSSPRSYGILSAGPKKLEGVWLEKQGKARGEIIFVICFTVFPRGSS